MIDPTPYVPSVLLGWQRAAPDQRVWVEDGAIAFLDVSGFTAMSERLGKLGREGAEVVTDVIGSTFDELLTVAYEAGGSLLKFGGDALLLWFGGAGADRAGADGARDGARRACFSAARVRSALRSMGPVPTPLGGVRIRMSAGVHAGRFHFFVVGSRGKELIVTGPGATRTVEMEAAAQAGQVLASPQTADLLGSRWFGHAAGPGVLLKLPPPIGERVKPTLPDATGVDVPSLLSTAVRRRLAEGLDEPEHRHAAVGFLKYGGVDALIERHGPDVAAERLHELVSTVQEACDEHEVALVNADVEQDGGKFLLCAGAPLAVGDEDERLLRTLRAVVHADTAIRCRGGAHRGLLFSGTVGPFYRRSYTLMGDVVNTAARVMAHAQPGQVLATGEVVDRTKSRFAVRALPAFSAKGKSRLLAPFEVGAPQAGLDEPGAAGPLLGRQDELLTLHRILGAARAGEGGGVDISGEAGIGKSRLVSAVSAAAVEAGMLGLVVRGDPYDASTPYSPFRRVLRALLRLGDTPDVDAVRRGLARLDPALAGDALFVAAAVGVEGYDGDTEVESYDRQAWRARLHAAVTGVLAAAAHRPLLLVAEDAQWLDEPSVDLVRHLGRAAASRPWVVAAVRRADAEPVLRRGERVEVGPLAEDDAARLVRSRTPFPLLPAQVAQIVERAGGNPLFLEQLAETFDPDAADVPAALEELVAARIDRLPAVPRKWLRELAVLGTAFEYDEAAVVMGRPMLEALDLAGPLEEFLDLRADGAAFRQHVFQSVAYAGLSFRRRRELHERVALHAEERGGGGADAAKLAKHFDMADRFDRSWKYGLRAAEHAYMQRAHGEAAALYRLALRAAGRLAEPPEGTDLRQAWLGLGQSLKFMGRHHDAFAPFRKARQLADGDAGFEAQACLNEGDLRQRLGRLPAAARWFGRGLRLIEGDDGDRARWTRVRLAMSLGKLRIDQGRYHDAEGLLRGALAQAEAGGDRFAIAHSSLWLAYALIPGHGDGYHDLAERALALYTELGAEHWTAAALNGLASACSREGRWSDAIALFRRAIDMLADADPMAQAVLAYNLGDLLRTQGRLEEAREWLDQASRTFTAASHPYAAVAQGSLAAGAAQAGYPEAADELFAEASAKLRAAGMAVFAREVDVNWAAALAYAGDVERAAEVLAASTPGADAAVEADASRVFGVIAFGRGDGETARRELAESLRRARAVDHPYAAALAVLTAEHLGIGLLNPELDRTEAELILARLGVVATPEPFVRHQHTDIARRELCTKQSS